MAGVSPVRDGLLVCVVPPFSPVSEPRLEWKVGLFNLDPDGAPCRSTRETSAEDNFTVITLDTHTDAHREFNTTYHIHMDMNKNRSTNKK